MFRLHNFRNNFHFKVISIAIDMLGCKCIWNDGILSHAQHLVSIRFGLWYGLVCIESTFLLYDMTSLWARQQYKVGELCHNVLILYSEKLNWNEIIIMNENRKMAMWSSSVNTSWLRDYNDDWKTENRNRNMQFNLPFSSAHATVSFLFCFECNSYHNVNTNTN